MYVSLWFYSETLFDKQYVRYYIFLGLSLQYVSHNQLWTDEYLQVVMTSQNVDLQELQILLKGGGDSNSF